MYSNMKYYENICNCLRVIQQDINRKLKSANCWQRTSLKVRGGLQINSIVNRLYMKINLHVLHEQMMMNFTCILVST